MISMELVMANGSVATFRKGDPEWNALAVGFGAFGVVTKIEFKLIPTFNVATYVFMKFVTIKVKYLKIHYLACLWTIYSTISMK